jgi:branched-chain amino acid transport system substrate-binding protein
MSSRQRLRAVAIAAAAVFIVASCGDDDDGAAGTTAAGGPEATDSTAPSTEGADTTLAADTGEGGETTEGGATTGGGDTEAPGGGGDLDSEHGQGAAAFQAAMEDTADAPLAADSSLEPFVIGIPNLEGDPAGTFPDVREGAEAAVKLVNERLGGIGADIEAGTGGRPIELSYCGHLVDQNEAQACANQTADANPNMIIPGVDFFTPLMYPLFTEFPVVEMLPIFIADFDQPGVYGIFGGCVTAFPSSAQLIAEVKGHDRLAVIWSDNAPGNECWTDTHERFYQYYADTLDNFEFQGFPYTPGDQATIPPVVQQMADYLAGAENPAVHLGAQAPDCAAQIQALRAAGVEAQIYTTAACDSEAIRDLPESEGIDFEVPGYIVEQPELYDEFIQFELAAREEAIDAYGPEGPKTAFGRQMFSSIIFAYQIANQALADGVDIDDREALREAIGAIDNFHLLGYQPISCAENTSEYESICNRKTGYAYWDGETFTIDEDVADGMDVTELLLAVEEALPRDQ